MKKTQNFFLVVCILIISLFFSIDSAVSFSLEHASFNTEGKTDILLKDTSTLIKSYDATIPGTCSTSKISSQKTVSHSAARLSVFFILIIISSAFYRTLKRSLFLCALKQCKSSFYLTCLQILYHTDGKKRLSFCYL